MSSSGDDSNFPSSPMERRKSKESSSSSSAGWNPDGEEVDDNSDKAERNGKTSIPSATSTTASQSRKRERSQSNASTTSVGWNPDDDLDSADADGDGGSIHNSDLPSQLPSQIDIAMTSDVALVGVGSKNHDHEYNEKTVTSCLDAVTSNKSHHTKPPERIRYQMLGAPTLLYRHAPSYLDPSNRPSVLTPQQLSMALYMNQHPIKDWFTNKQLRDTRKHAHHRTTKNAFLTSTYVPQPPRPWGRPHDWDWRHGYVTSECRTAKDLRRQAELDAHNLVEDIHCANRAKVRWFWGDVEKRNRDEQQRNLPPKSRQRRRSITGFDAFCSEYIKQLKQSNQFTSDSVASAEPRHQFQLASKAWNELSKDEQSSYDGKAKTLNLPLEEQNHFEPKGDKEEERNNAPTSHQRHQARKEKKSRKGKTTGFNLFRFEYMQSNAPAANATDADRKARLMEASKLAGSEWKEMADEEKYVYIQKAKAENDKNDNHADKSLAKSKDSENEGDGEEQPFGVEQEQKGIRVHKSKRKTSSFHVFRSEYMLRWKQSNPNAIASDRQVSMIKCCKEASADWKKMSTSERSVYQQKAEAENEWRGRRQFSTEPKQIRQNCVRNGRKGRTTGFNIFRSEAMSRLRESNPLPDGANTADKEEYFKKLTKQTSQQWKEMPDNDKSRYKQDADRRNELSSAGSEKYVKDSQDFDNMDGSSSSSGDATFDDESLFNPKQLDHDQERLMVGGDQKNYNPYVGLGEIDSTDIQQTYDRLLSSSLEHVESCPDYFAPFRRHDVGVGFRVGDNAPLERLDRERSFLKRSKTGGEDVESKESNETVNIKNGEIMIDEKVETDQMQGDDTGLTTTKYVLDRPISEDLCEDRHGAGGPSGYGNCLVSVPCRCLHCERQSSSWFIIHPSGENLSHLTLSKMLFPRDSSLRGGDKVQKIDVGGRILQISQCGAAVSHLKSADQILCFIARTSQYCSVVYAKATSKPSPGPDECPIEFHVREETRIDLRAPFGSLRPSYLPVHVTCDPKATVSFCTFTCPSIAILSRDYSGNCTTIHRVSLREEPDAKTHPFTSSLEDISLIEFDPNDRGVVWAAARSRTRPKLTAGFFKTRNGTVAGHGHSLYRIDLRNDSISLVWSPSHAEYLTEGLHSINGIMADAVRPHVVWVSSSSACKVWALDVRHKSAQVVVSWSLPSLCDDFGPQMAVTGIYGGGFLMSQPLQSSWPSNNRVISSPTMFSLKKDPNSHAVNVHQFPSAMPRFYTQPLESAGFGEVSKLKYDVNSIARSAIFPLPDVSSNIFNTGLATLQCPSRTALNEKQLDRLGYHTPPVNVTYVITMTSLGDMYCHSLLETDALEETQARQFSGLPVGTMAVPVPGKGEKKAKPDPSSLSISLSNEFPFSSNAITPYAVQKA
ncbi:hypothetical protein ACHAXR_011533, partial [Thalassiosira sp. AJA248-18]